MLFHSNEPTSSVTHIVGFLLSIAGLVLLIVYSSLYATVRHIVTFSLFGAMLILTYFSSAMYHILPNTVSTKMFFQHMDHSMIYFLIAATYTPVTLIVLRGGLGWTIFGIIWGLATFGIVLQFFRRKLKIVFSTLHYLLMGWLGIVAFSPLSSSLHFEGMMWLFLGGIFYTIGVLFFALDHVIARTRWFGMHEIFHLFVMAGSFSHFWLMFRYVMYI